MGNILLVEDDELVRALLEAQLESLGFRVRSAPDGRAALRELERDENVDLLMTDVVLPGGLDGYALADRLHAERPDVPILFVSGSAAREDAAPPNAVTQYLEKPFRLSALESSVHGLMEHRRARRAVAS